MKCGLKTGIWAVHFGKNPMPSAKNHSNNRHIYLSINGIRPFFVSMVKRITEYWPLKACRLSMRPNSEEYRRNCWYIPMKIIGFQHLKIPFFGREPFLPGWING